MLVLKREENELREVEKRERGAQIEMPLEENDRGGEGGLVRGRGTIMTPPCTTGDERKEGKEEEMGEECGRRGAGRREKGEASSNRSGTGRN